MIDQADKDVLRAELNPEREARRRNALGNGLGALLLRQQLQASAKQLPALKLPAWAAGFEPEQKRWLKKVLQRAQ